MRAVVAAALVSLIATAASAQDSAPSPAPGAFQPFAYGQLRLGLFAPQSSDMQGFGNGFAVGGALGYRFHPNLAGEVDLGYHRSTASASAQGRTVEATFSIIPIAVNFKAIAPLGPLDLYGLVGVGVHEITLEGSVSGVGSASTSTSAFGYHVGAGLSIPMSPAASLGLDLRYAAADASFQGTSGKVDGLLATGAVQFRF